MGAEYTLQELMVAAAAREIKDGEVVFVGMRLPMLAFAVAKHTHAPGAIGLFENGIYRDLPAAETLFTMSDPPNVRGAAWVTRMLNVLGLLGQRAVDVGFVGGAEVDRFGNINTSYIGDPARPQVKLPGSGGAADIAALAKRLLIIIPQEKRRFVPRVGYITSPGYGDGPGWRERVGLLPGGPSAIISSLGVYGFADCEAYLRTYHPGLSVEAVQAETGWPLKVAPDVGPTPPPTAEELAVIRRYDPDGHWTRRSV